VKKLLEFSCSKDVDVLVIYASDPGGSHIQFVYLFLKCASAPPKYLVLSRPAAGHDHATAQSAEADRTGVRYHNATRRSVALCRFFLRTGVRYRNATPCSRCGSPIPGIRPGYATRGGGGVPTDQRDISNHPAQEIEDAAPRRLDVKEEEVGVVVVAAESKRPRARAVAVPFSGADVPPTASRAAATTASELAGAAVEEEAEVEVRSAGVEAVAMAPSSSCRRTMGSATATDLRRRGRGR
jgi:hypothetical protein